jgi:hypothetical protein
MIDSAKPPAVRSLQLSPLSWLRLAAKHFAIWAVAKDEVIPVLTLRSLTDPELIDSGQTFRLTTTPSRRATRNTPICEVHYKQAMGDG